MKREGCPCPWLSRCRLWRVASKAGSCRSDLKGATTEDGVTNPSSWGSGQYPTTANVKTNENRNANTQQLSVQCTRFAWLSVTGGETLSMDVTMHPSCQLEWFQSSLTLSMFSIKWISPPPLSCWHVDNLTLHLVIHTLHDHSFPQLINHLSMVLGIQSTAAIYLQQALRMELELKWKKSKGITDKPTNFQFTTLQRKL